MVVLALGAAAAWFVRPSRGGMAGLGADPDFNLWLFENVWSRISAHGPLWFLDVGAWRTQIYGGVPLGLAYSENEQWAALATWPLFRLTGSGSLTLQLYMVVCVCATYAATHLWLRRYAQPGTAMALSAFVATCGWMQSQMVHLFCLFTLPLAALAADHWRSRRTAAGAALTGIAAGWICGWNLYYFVFASAWCAVVLLRNPRHLAVALLAGSAVAFPLLRPYLLLDRVVGVHPALLCYGLHPFDLFSRLHVPALLWPRESNAVPGGMTLSWLALVLLSLRIEKARPWLLAMLVTFWISTGSSFGAWQAVGWLPAVNSLRAIGRLQSVTILLSLVPIAAALGRLPPKVRALGLALLLLESIPRRPMEHVPPVPISPPPFALGQPGEGPPLLVLPLPDSMAMVALQSWRIAYQGGYSGFAPLGQELLAKLSPTDAIASARPRYVLARTPEIAAQVNGVRRAEVTFLGRPATLFELQTTPEAVQLAATRPRQGPLTLELFAESDGVLSINDLDRCALRIESAFGPVVIRRKVKLQWTDFAGVRLHRGELVYRHRLRPLFDVGRMRQQIECL